MPTKICVRCNQEKDLSEFNKKADSADGRQSWCRDCASKNHAGIKASQKLFITEKRCSACNQIKHVSAFSKHTGRKDGLQSYCKVCQQNAIGQYRKKKQQGITSSRFQSIKDVAIIPSKIGDSEIQTVNARDLHEFLESKQQFADWIKNRIQEYGFQETVDFIHTSENYETSTGAVRKIDYHISLSMAKELCMVERNDKGKEARLYFIECEKRLKQLVERPMTTAEILVKQATAFLEYEKEMLAVKQVQDKQTEILTQHEEKLHDIESKVITTNSDFYTISGFANLRGYKIDVRQAAMLGKLSSKLSRDYDYHIGSVKDERYGSVNTYHSDILVEVFEKSLNN